MNKLEKEHTCGSYFIDDHDYVRIHYLVHVVIAGRSRNVVTDRRLEL